MANINLVTDCLDTLTARLKTVCAVKNALITLYNEDDLLNTKDTLGYPAVGVVYVGLRARDSKGLAADMIFDIYLIGGEECKGADAPSTTKILDDIRNAIKCNTCDQVGAARTWQFVFEIPHEFSKDHIAYVQRWKTPVILTN